MKFAKNLKKKKESEQEKVLFKTNQIVQRLNLQTFLLDIFQKLFCEVVFWGSDLGFGSFINDVTQLYRNLLYWINRYILNLATNL